MDHSKRTLILSFLVIVAVNVTVFFPSFFHVARADQLIYLIETAEKTDAGQLLAHSYSFPRTRTIFQGDQFLFRPILFSFMAVEKLCFGYQFIYWQLVGFFLHLLLLWQLLNILNKVRPGFLAGAVVLSFSVLYLSQEMVIWHGISGYLLALNFMLAAFSQWINFIKSKEEDARPLMLMTGFLFLACLTYEYAVIFSIVLAMATAWHRGLFLKDRRWACLKIGLVILWPVLAYVALSVLDYAYHPGFGQQAMAASGYSAIDHYIQRFGYMLMIIVLAVFLPQFTQINAMERLQLTGFSLPDIYTHFGHYQIGEVLNIVMLILVAVMMVMIGIKIFTKRPAPQEFVADHSLTLMVLGVSFVLGMLYIVLIAAARPIGYLANGLYHFYIIYLFLAMAGFCFICLFEEILLSRHIKILGLTAVVLAVCVNGSMCFQFNTAFWAAHEPWRIFILNLEKFVHEHEQEKDFSFDVASQATQEIPIIYGFPTNGRMVKQSEYRFLFSRYVKTDHPKYFLIDAGSTGLLKFNNRREAEKALEQAKP